MTGPLRVLLADDHPVFRKGLRALLTSLPEAVVIGEASDGAAAVVLAAECQPDLVVMDVHMPELDGVEATRRIVVARPATRVLILTMFDDDESVFAAVQAGARGYVLKGAQRSELFRAIRAVAAGDAIFGPGIARRLVGYFARPRPRGLPAPFPDLTDREREILELVAQGRSNAEITSLLVLSPKTIRNHVSNMFAKLQVRDRAEAIVRAREAGLGGEAGRPG